MEIKRRTEITVETHEITIIRVSSGNATEAFCVVCRAAQKHFSVRRAAAVLRLSEKELFRMVESEQLHSVENVRGELFICGSSITAADRSNR